MARIFIIRTLHQILRWSSQEDEVGGGCSGHREIRNAYKILVRNPEGKTTLGSLRHR